MKIKIAIADDHVLFTKGLENILNHIPSIEIVGIYTNGEELLKGLQQHLPDIVLLDIQMPGKTGDQVAGIITKKYPSVKMIALTGFDSALYVTNMMAQGVKGYVLKVSGEDILIEAINKVYHGETYIAESIRQKAWQQEQSVKRSMAMKSHLTPREKEILQLIAEGLTSAEISARLFLSNHTVINYRDNILLKLDVKNTALLIAKAMRLGLIN
jgi:DNA-binding NarL/FixJ family response regulator